MPRWPLWSGPRAVFGSPMAESPGHRGVPLICFADLPVMVNMHKFETDIPAEDLRDGSLDLSDLFWPPSSSQPQQPQIPVVARR